MLSDLLSKLLSVFLSVQVSGSSRLLGKLLSVLLSKLLRVATQGLEMLCVDSVRERRMRPQTTSLDALSLRQIWYLATYCSHSQGGNQYKHKSVFTLFHPEGFSIHISARAILSSHQPQS